VGTRPAAQGVVSRAAVLAAPAILLSAVVLLPFLGKAFTIDDTLFLKQARHALSDPLHPSAVEMVWSESPWPVRLSQVAPNGPLMAWLLVPTVLAGGSEVVAHLLQLVLLAVGIFETALLALRLGADARTAAGASLLLASTPAVLAMAGTAMPDLAAMTLGVSGIERLVAWRDGARPRDAVLAALLLALAPLARIHSVLLLLLAPFLLGLPRGREDVRRWMPVVAAPVFTLLAVLVTRDPLGSSADLARSASLFSGFGSIRSNAIAFATHQMLVLPLGLAWILARGRSFWISTLPLAGISAAAAALWLGGESSRLWLAPVTGLGAAVLAGIAADALRQRDRSRMLLAAWLLLPLPIVVYLHLPPKYLLVSAPAASILAASAIAKRPRAQARVLTAGLAAAGVVLGVAILRADAAFANLGRRAADELIAPQVRNGATVWFNGHWGFQWYAERAGARCLTAKPPQPRRGDFVVSAKNTITSLPLESLSFRRELVASVADSSPGGRLLDSERGAGFWSNGWGYLPWVWGSGELDRFDLWRVR
jgi:4-amino-4-deoxy-L-arabinose transferase-like glycosyltransferase